MLRGYQIELGYGGDHIRLSLSMDGILLSRMLANLYDPEKKVSDPSLVDLALVLAAGNTSYEIEQILSSKRKETSTCARQYYPRCACTAFAYLSHGATIQLRLPESLLDLVVRAHVRTSP